MKSFLSTDGLQRLIELIKSSLDLKQNKLVPGDNININENTIAAVDTKYTGDGVTVNINENNVISCIGGPSGTSAHLKEVTIGNNVTFMLGRNHTGLGFTDGTDAAFSVSKNHETNIAHLFFDYDDAKKVIFLNFTAEIVSGKLDDEDKQYTLFTNGEMSDLLTRNTMTSFDDNRYQLMLCGLDTSAAVICQNIISGLFRVQDVEIANRPYTNYIEFGGLISRVYGDCIVSPRYQTNDKESDTPYPPVLVLDFKLVLTPKDFDEAIAKINAIDSNSTKVYLYATSNPEGASDEALVPILHTL